MKARWHVTGLAVIAALGGVAAARPQRTTAQVSAGPLVERVVARAEVVPADGVAEVRARMDGRVLRVLVRVGDRVAAGALLAEIESAPAAAELARREAEGRALRAAVRVVREGARHEERDALAAEARAARHEASRAEEHAARLARLLRHRSVGESEADDARHAADAARARYEAIEARAHLASAGGRSAEVSVAREHAAAAEASVTEARDALERAHLVAPVAGEVLARRVDPGDTVVGSQVGAGVALFEVADVDATEIRVEVEEGDAFRVQQGQPVEITRAGGGEVVGTGTIARLSSRLEPRTIDADDVRARADARVRTAWVALSPAAAAARWPVGQRFEARITLATRRVSARAPRGAVQVRDGHAVVTVPWFIFTRERTIDLGATDDDYVEVSGLPAGTAVVLRDRP